MDSLIGETALALEDIAPGAMGKVELRGASWTARNIGDQPIQRSERPKVERVDGLTLYDPESITTWIHSFLSSRFWRS